MRTDFNLHVLDNFLSNETFLKILNITRSMDWDSMGHTYTEEKIKGKHVWFSREIDPNGFIAKDIKNTIKNKSMLVAKKFSLLSFTMATKVKAFPHEDVGNTFKNQLILYVDGNTDINKGTGFYVKKNDEFILNTHVGFQKNRAILFKSGMWHSPLLFNANDSTPRISIIAQF